MTNALDRIPAMPAAPAPDHVGQATAIEQSRAVAEVQAAVIVAQQRPRDVDAALAEMRRSCERPSFAARAFYTLPRGQDTVTGETIHFARELARVWGNVQDGIAELRRDDVAGYSEIQAWAWDLQTNKRTALTFVVPHRRDLKAGKSRQLVTSQEIYESNTNAGSRRLRQAILSILPPWFVDEAKELCNATLTAGSPEEIAAKVARMLPAYERLGVTQAQLEQKVGRARVDWTGREFAQLDILYGTLKRGEITVDEAFPAARVTREEIEAAAVDADEAGRVSEEDWPATAQPGGGEPA